MTAGRIGRVVKFVLFNTFLVVALWLALLFGTAVVGDVYNWARIRWPRTDERVKLPNYADKERASLLFANSKKTVEDYVPFLGWRRLPMTTEYVNIGEDGFRTHKKGRENNVEDAVKIGFFGGSTIWGTGVDDDSTIPALFDQLTTEYEVTNYGEGGHNPRQMLALLMNLIDARQLPDVVVFYDGFNHVWTHCDYAVTRSLNGHMVERKLRENLTERPRWGYFFADIIAPPLHFFRRIIGKKKFVHHDYACHNDALRAEQVAEALLRIWEMADVVTTHWGGRFYAFLQPVAYIGEPRLDYLEPLSTIGSEQFRAVYPIIQAKARERDVPWFTDLSDAFDGAEPIYIDDVHVTRNGNAIIADRILQTITTESVLRTALGVNGR